MSPEILTAQYGLLGVEKSFDKAGSDLKPDFLKKSDVYSFSMLIYEVRGSRI